MPEFKSSRFPALDGWRAIAIGLVMWHHATTGFYANEDLYYNTSKSQLGAFGVDIFFGLSGLLISALLLEEYSQKGSISLAGFYTRRIFRILPPCFAFLLMAVLLGLIQSPLELASCLAFFRNYLPVSLGGYYTGHLWSLAVEEHFYLLWPAVLVWLIARDFGARPVAYLSIFFGLWRVFDAQTGATSHLLPAVRAGVMNLVQMSRSLRAFLSADNMVTRDPASALQRFSFQNCELGRRLLAGHRKGKVFRSCLVISAFVLLRIKTNQS